MYNVDLLLHYYKMISCLTWRITGELNGIIPRAAITVRETKNSLYVGRIIIW